MLDEFPESSLDVTAEDTPAAEMAPRIWPTFVVPLLALVLAVVVQIVVVGVMVVILFPRGIEQSEIREQLVEMMSWPGVFLLILAGSQAAFGCVTLLAAYLSPEPMRQRLGFRSVAYPAKVYGLTMLGSILPLAVALAAAHLLAKLITPDQTFAVFFEKLTPLWGLALVVLVAFAPGFIEEMMFRGYIQQRLLKRWKPFWAIAVTSVLFTLVHVTPHAMTVALPLGIWLGIIAWRTNSIGPSIACHAFVNGGLNAWRLVVKFGEVNETAQTVCHVIFVLIGVVCFVMACRLLANYRSEPDVLIFGSTLQS